MLTLNKSWKKGTRTAVRTPNKSGIFSFILNADRTRTLQNSTANQPTASQQLASTFEARIYSCNDSSGAGNKLRCLWVSASRFTKYRKWHAGYNHLENCHPDNCHRTIATRTTTT